LRRAEHEVRRTRRTKIKEWFVGEALLNARRLADGTVVIEVRGEIDVASAAQLRALLVDNVANLRPISIVVDLRHVTFVDSTGIGALAAGQNAARRVGVGFRVSNPTPFVSHQLRIMGLAAQLGVTD
jgi:anti-sigma B factor antagonist